MTSLPKTFRAWSLSQNGIDYLKLSEHTLPEQINEHQIVLKIKAAGLNPVDYKKCVWGPGPFNQGFPRAIGTDFVGQVIRIGSKVDPSTFKVNETIVYGLSGWEDATAAFGEYKIQDSRTVTIVPKELIQEFGEQQLFTDLATFPVSGFTAVASVLTKLKLPLHSDPQNISNKYTRNVFVTAGAGGVGGFVLQLLRVWRENNFDENEQKEVRIITSCSSKNFEYVKRLGATHVIDYTVDDVSVKLKEILGDTDQLDAWIDSVGQHTTEQGLNAIGFRGELVVIVSNTDYTNRLFAYSKSAHSVSLGSCELYGAPKHVKDFKFFGEVLLNLYAQKKVFVEKRIIHLEEIKENLIEISKGHTKGKIVMVL